jgi:hypothetical protein
MPTATDPFLTKRQAVAVGVISGVVYLAVMAVLDRVGHDESWGDAVHGNVFVAVFFAVCMSAFPYFLPRWRNRRKNRQR